MRRRTFLGAVAAGTLAGAAPPPLRLGMAGLVHGHAAGLPGPLPRQQGRRAGRHLRAGPRGRRPIRRSNPGSTRRRSIRSLDEMLDQAKPQAVVAFTSTSDHPAVVAACAARKIPVMMEKPLAVSVEQARAIERSARRGRHPRAGQLRDHLVPAIHAAYDLVKEEKAVGEIRKMVVHDGHRGPKEIGVQPEFLAWLTDPVKNGAGALFDFGCYGANLMTWLMDDARPTSVTAVTQRFKPDIYPNVDDEATIILEYPGAQAIIQASWNWPFGRKDMEVYGRTGQVLTVGQNGLRVRLEGKPEETRQAPPLPPPETTSCATSPPSCAARSGPRASRRSRTT